MSNKEDFEKALDELDSLHTQMIDVIRDDALDIIANVMSEYNDHFKDNIEEAIDKLDYAEMEHSL